MSFSLKMRKELEESINKMPAEPKAHGMAILALAEELSAAREQGKKRHFLMAVSLVIADHIQTVPAEHAIKGLLEFVRGLEAIKGDLAKRLLLEAIKR